MSVTVHVNQWFRYRWRFGTHYGTQTTLQRQLLSIFDICDSKGDQTRDLSILITYYSLYNIPTLGSILTADNNIENKGRL